jgi:two-component system catabolic regulation response regulator CreB/two-component system response regulator ChvI
LSSAAESKAALYSSSYKYKGRILLVDDEVDVARSFSLAFQKDGFIVDTYNDPIKALSNFKTDLYDIVLLDIRLPNMDGFELYEKIRNIDKRVKVCFMSAFPMNYLALREQGLQIECIISKPIRIKDLVRGINAELV